MAAGFSIVDDWKTVTIDEVMAQAGALVDRLTAAQAAAELRDGAVLVDIRPEFQRRADGEIPGAVVIERVHLEWRCDPTSYARVTEAVNHDVRWIVCCDEGYSSLLAAVSLRAVGLRRATDVIDGFRAWRAAGLPVVHPAEPNPPRLYRPGSVPAPGVPSLSVPASATRGSR
jgi:rhodanese-related sulfurtransferase